MPAGRLVEAGARRWRRRLLERVGAARSCRFLLSRHRSWMSCSRNATACKRAGTCGSAELIGTSPSHAALVAFTHIAGLLSPFLYGDQHSCYRSPLNEGRHMLTPNLQRHALLVCEVVTLINPDDAGPAS